MKLKLLWFTIKTLWVVSFTINKYSFTIVDGFLKTRTIDFVNVLNELIEGIKEVVCIMTKLYVGLLNENIRNRMTKKERLITSELQIGYSGGVCVISFLLLLMFLHQDSFVLTILSIMIFVFSFILTIYIHRFYGPLFVLNMNEKYKCENKELGLELKKSLALINDKGFKIEVPITRIVNVSMKLLVLTESKSFLYNKNDFDIVVLLHRNNQVINNKSGEYNYWIQLSQRNDKIVLGEVSTIKMYYKEKNSIGAYINENTIKVLIGNLMSRYL